MESGEILRPKSSVGDEVFEDEVDSMLVSKSKKEENICTESNKSQIMRRKFTNFRSDSMFSDVVPIRTSSSSTDDKIKTSESTDKSTSSLTNLKKESKWSSLRKKLKLNSPPSSNSGLKIDKSEQSEKSGKIGVEKRSLFQRAKTLSILPVKQKSGEEAEKSSSSSRSKRHQIIHQEPKELFNVGGEMNLIPLELLIDINDLKNTS